MMKYLRKLLAVVLPLMLLSACEPLYDSYYNSYAPGYDSSISEQSMSIDYQPDQQVVVTASASIETKDYAETVDQIETLIKDHQGLIRSQDHFRSEDLYTSTPLSQKSLVIDVPSDRVEAFIQALQEDYRLSHLSSSSYDASGEITYSQDRLQEIEARIAVIQTQLDDDDVSNEEKSALRGELADLEAEKLIHEFNLQDTHDRVEYSSVSLDIRQVLRYSDEAPTIGHQFRRAFNGFFGMAIPALSASLVSLFFVIPYIIVGVITYLITRKLVNKWIHKPKDK